MYYQLYPSFHKLNKIILTIILTGPRSEFRGVHVLPSFNYEIDLKYKEI